LAGRATVGDDYSDKDIQGEVTSQDLPLIRLDVINEATKQFSDENKLGQGGFGPVYRVIKAIKSITLFIKKTKKKKSNSVICQSLNTQIRKCITLWPTNINAY